MVPRGFPGRRVKDRVEGAPRGGAASLPRQPALEPRGQGGRLLSLPVVRGHAEDDAGGTSSGKAYIYNPNTIFTTNTVGFNVGDFISSTSDLFAFASGTIITAVTTNTSITISTPLLNTLPAGSNLTSQRKWIPIIGTSPVLSVQDVNSIQDIWALILG